LLAPRARPLPVHVRLAHHDFDIEVIAADDAAYKAVVTFFNEWTVHTYVHERVAEACAALWDECGDDKLAERLLTHRDLPARLHHRLMENRRWPAMIRLTTIGLTATAIRKPPSPTGDSDGALPTASDLHFLLRYLSASAATSHKAGARR